MKHRLSSGPNSNMHSRSKSKSHKRIQSNLKNSTKTLTPPPGQQKTCSKSRKKLEASLKTVADGPASKVVQLTLENAKKHHEIERLQLALIN